MPDAANKPTRWPIVAAVALLGAAAVALTAGLPYLQRYNRLQSDPREPESGQLDFSNSIIPRREMLSGGPPKDGIPALTDPAVVPAAAATYLADDDRVIGVLLQGEARAYPLKLLNFHEIVNDEVGGRVVAITYCPLCDSAIAFSRESETAGQTREFGVSGLLYNSNVLMYDRGDSRQSLWSQMSRQGVSGPQVSTKLATLPVELTVWLDWKSRHPKTKVLSDKTGFDLSYDFNPYNDYFLTDKLWFPVSPQSDALAAKVPVLGVWTEQGARAYPLTAFDKAQPVVEDVLDGRSLRIRFDPKFNSLRVEQADEGLNWIYAFWFAWYAFHPQTEVFETATQDGPRS